MSFYHLINGVNPSALLIMPMLDKHPDWYPRFRDCFVGDKAHPEYDHYIHVYTRTGGGNREAYEAENDAIRALPGFVVDYDDEDDPTYASWIFEVPERWADDFNKIIARDLNNVSPEYRAKIHQVYPNMTDVINKTFMPKENAA